MILLPILTYKKELCFVDLELEHWKHIRKERRKREKLAMSLQHMEPGFDHHEDVGTKEEKKSESSTGVVHENRCEQEIVVEVISNSLLIFFFIYQFKWRFWTSYDKINFFLHVGLSCSHPPVYMGVYDLVVKKLKKVYQTVFIFKRYVSARLYNFVRAWMISV